MSIVITLDSVKKYRPNSKREYRWINRVIFEGEEFVGDGYTTRLESGMDKSPIYCPSSSLSLNCMSDQTSPMDGAKS